MTNTDRDARILQLHAQGRKQRDIAAEVGCSLGWVNTVIKKATTPQVDLSDMVTAALANLGLTAEPGADLAVDDTVIAEVIDTPDQLDRRLRGCARDADRSWARLVEAVAAALGAEVHRSFGFASPVKYLADVLDTEMPSIARDVGQRRKMVALLAEHSMSQRDIADVVGVSQKTIDRDQDQLSHDDSVQLPDKVNSRDGKQRPAHPQPKPAPEPQPSINETLDVAAAETADPLDVDEVPIASNIREDADYLTQVVPHLIESVRRLQPITDPELVDQVLTVADMLIDAGNELRHLAHEASA